MPRQVPKVGDVFAVPLDDGSSTIGQVVEATPILMNSITCLFFDAKADDPELSDDQSLAEYKPISCQFVTRDSFNRGKWRRLANVEVTFPEAEFPYRETENDGWVGAKVIGSGIITGFLNAYYSLRDWHEMKDPDYYAKLLLPGVSRPF